MFRSIRSQLFCMLGLSMLLAAGVVVALAYIPLSETIRRDNIQLVGLAAEGRKNLVLRILKNQRDRALSFLYRAELICGMRDSKKRACLKSELERFSDVEGADAARLVVDDSPALTFGRDAELSREVGQPDMSRVATFGFDRHLVPYYALQVESRRFGKDVLTVYLKAETLKEAFANPRELGHSGELFLIGPQGLFVTEPRFTENVLPNRRLKRNVAVQRCLAGQDGDNLGPDYRGVATIHGFRHIPEIGGGCVMANMAQAEAFVALERLRIRIAIVVALFLILALFLAYSLARLITGPLERLSARANALKAGDLNSPVPVEGPNEVKSFARVFAEMTQSLRQAIQAREEILSIVSHDLKSPLSAFSLSTGLIRRLLKMESSESQKERLLSTLDGMERVSEQMRKLTEDLLDLGRIQSGHLTLDRMPESLEEIVRDTAKTFELQAEQKGLRIRVQLEEVTLNVDRSKIVQVLSNLVGNAVKFTSVGEIGIELKREPAEACLRVTDTGPGIAAEELVHLFDRYWQAQETKRQGTGLGLYIAKAIVDAHGGRIEVESELGRGTAFTIRLPLQC